MSSQFEEFLEVRTTEEWARLVFDFTLPAVKRLLNGNVPTYEELATLGWQDTNEAGS